MQSHSSLNSRYTDVVDRRIQEKYPAADILVAFGTGKYFRHYHINTLCEKLGRSCLPSFHAFTGCDSILYMIGQLQVTCTGFFSCLVMWLPLKKRLGGCFSASYLSVKFWVVLWLINIFRLHADFLLFPGVYGFSVLMWHMMPNWCSLMGVGRISPVHIEQSTYSVYSTLSHATSNFNING